ncbi:MAG: hypothetical protein NTW87_27720 [Planctomycetota bacterium]|nr:hypothetical protein [Planctomycetota bacterium]
MFLMLSASVAAGEYTPPDKAKALEAVQNVVAETVRSGRKLEVWLTVLGSSQKTEVAKADAKSLSVKIQGNVMDQPWQKIAPAEIAGVMKACVLGDAQRALVLADYCLATGQPEKADEALMAAAQANPNLGEELSARLKYVQSAAGAKTEATTPSGKAETGAASESGSAGGAVQITDRSGRLDRAAYLREAMDWSLQAIHQKLGPDYEQYHKKDKKPEEFPTVWMPEDKTSKVGRNGKGFVYQVGGPPTENPGDYSSTQGQLFYIPDKPADPGVDRIDILGMGHNCFTYKPAPPWWGGWRPEPAVTTPAWKQAAGGNLGAPVAMARSAASWSNSAVLVFSSGLVGCAGTCTSQNSNPFFVFPKNKVPTAVAVTNKNEFALITVWDVEKMKGEVAVLALESMHTDGLMALYEWHAIHPGLPNVGGIRSMKLLGYVPLPFASPTGICAVGNRGSEWVRLNGKNSQLGDVDLSQQALRDSFYKGENKHITCSAGFAVVISRYENKAAFLDLQPLFQYMREMYFTTEENYKKTREYGPGPKQWPYDFEVDARPKPPLVAVVDVPQPTAVNASLFGGKEARAYIATLDGRLGIYQVGGLATEDPANPADVRCAGLVQVGRNPTCIAYHKNVGWGTPDYLRTAVIVVCRGDREIQWVRFKGDTGEVYKRLRDSRMVDPVHAEMADTHGTESHILTVTDFKGRKVINYRFGPVVYHTNAGARFEMGADGKADFECGGVMEFPGYPYKICTTNVN